MYNFHRKVKITLQEQNDRVHIGEGKLMEKHVTFVAVLNIAFGMLGVLMAAVAFTAIVGGGLISDDDRAIAITLVVGTSVAFFFLVLSVPELIGGIGLLKGKGWARILIMIIACIDLVLIPFGTAIGIYTLWVMLNDDTAKLFSKPPEQF